MKQTQSLPGYVLSLLLAYLVSFFLTLFIVVLILGGTLFSGSYHIKQVDRSGFSGLAFSELQEIFRSHGASSRIPEDIMLSTLTLQQVDDAVKASLTASFDGGVPYSYEKYQSGIYQVLYAYARGTGIPDSEELQMVLNDLADLCRDALISRTDSTFYGYITQTVERYGQALTMGTIGLGIAIAVLAFALIVLNRRNRKLAEYGVYIFGSVAIMCALVPIVVRVTGVFERLNLTPASFNRLFSDMLNGCSDKFFVALIPVMIGLALCLTIRLIFSGAARGTR